MKTASIKSGNFSWMKGCEDKKSESVGNLMRATGNLYKNIAVKGKTRKAFEGYK